MKIGQLAAATGTQAETIRYYEQQALLPAPARTQSNYRVYDASHVERLAFIRHCRCLDMTLGEIRALLQYKDAPAGSCAPVNDLLDEHIGHVAARIAELLALQRELQGLRLQCTSSEQTADCGILSGLEQAARDHHHAGASGADSPGPASAGVAQEPAREGHRHEGHVPGTHRLVGKTAGNL